MVNSNISICKTKKLDHVLNLNALIFPEDDLNVGDNTFHWIATDKRSKEPIGFCSVTDFGEGILFLSRAGLLPEYRGRNIQRKFIRLRERFARSNGYKKIITYTLKDNYQSMNSLFISGYKIYTPEFQYVGPGYMYYIKELE
jgi:GNAT superfamily N-acetyltransferase